jgi:hypothetical protein
MSIFLNENEHHPKYIAYAKLRGQKYSIEGESIKEIDEKIDKIMEKVYPMDSVFIRKPVWTIEEYDPIENKSFMGFSGYTLLMHYIYKDFFSRNIELSKGHDWS